MTECSETLFQFEAHFSRQVVAEFSGARLTTEGGSLLLRQRSQDRLVATHRGLLHRLPAARSGSNTAWKKLLAQRIYGSGAWAYEDLNAHEQLRQDPLLAVLAGKREIGESRWPVRAPLNRLELTPLVRLPRNATTKSAIAPKRWMNCWSISFWKRTTKPRAKSCGPGRHRHAAARAAGGAGFFHGY